MTPTMSTPPAHQAPIIPPVITPPAHQAPQTWLPAQNSTELMESVTYARRIQETILPGRMLFTSSFTDSFVMFRPTAIVSGDFYYYARLGSKVVVAVADCTGHGVPGAMVSIMGYTILDDIVKCNGLTNPAKILTRLDKAVRKLFKQGRSEHGIDDGMDIAVCTVDYDNHTMEFASAYRPLYHFSGDKLNIFQGNKNGIGGVVNQQDSSFEAVTIPFEPGDSIYMFSDGYTDQFGGDFNKKFMRKRFISLLQSIQDFNMNDQQMQIELEHRLWKGACEQTDDITVMGLKLK
jgi:serine phosphatase RsbU (regulator of sigma subunit)